MSISAMENLYSTAERRMLKNDDSDTSARIIDFWGVIPSITGKVELVYEGEQSGPYDVALSILESAIQDLFLMYFDNPDKGPQGENSPYVDIKNYFEQNNSVSLLNDASNKDYQEALDAVDGLSGLVNTKNFEEQDQYLAMELVLHGLATFNVLEREIIDNDFEFSDPLSGMFDDEDGDLGDLLE
jgi:magnesium chelatase subunit I